jgi:hypothetical protein
MRPPEKEAATGLGVAGRSVSWAHDLRSVLVKEDVVATDRRHLWRVTRRCGAQPAGARCAFAHSSRCFNKCPRSRAASVRKVSPRASDVGCLQTVHGGGSVQQRLDAGERVRKGNIPRVRVLGTELFTDWQRIEIRYLRRERPSCSSLSTPLMFCRV